ncbi:MULTISPECIES: transaldolase [Lentzea]|uniref:Transaldolase n=1 Tax=Lentzea fradiae TaxID=200378 RepID=A0A1G7WHT7_9PSEU|nr:MULTISPECIES: transaldolase [Lentzea]GLY49953.1 transaldolase [Lentzea sp. NBRC 102530]SDG71434.1 transaldolase [Lentzea fradiae]
MATGHDHPLTELAAAGVSIWLDDLSRELLSGGRLQALIADRGVVGITTNPTIFASALERGERYTRQLRRLAEVEASIEDMVFAITTDDVREACHVLRPAYDRTDGVDGRVSLEVDPGLAHDTQATIDRARLLWSAVDEPNLLIKIPATTAGLDAITAVIGEGISVNVTLIFSLDRYREVVDAYLTGLETARLNGLDLAGIHSVASFFVSRVDTEIDARLDAIGTDRALAAKGRAAIANARLAHEVHVTSLATRRWRDLAASGARPQRPLWASTGVKNPAYPDTMYVSELAIPGTVNTMPGPTLEAFADHGTVTPVVLEEVYGPAQDVLSEIALLGIDYREVTDELERQGVRKFVDSWDELVETVRGELSRDLAAPAPHGR